jgi:carotene biosynthesis associated membrane protein
MFTRTLTKVILVIYALLTAYSLISLLAGLPYHPFFTPLLTLLAFAFAILHSGLNLGWKKALLLLILTFAISLLFECVGVATGWVYGPYHYTDKLGPKFLGLVPLLIPIAWFMMTYPSYLIARYLVPDGKNTLTWRLLVAGLGAVIMTSWDLAMDPMMVAGGHWVWEQPGAYFGIPLQNYWGWWLTIFVTFWLFLSLARIHPGHASAKDLFSHLPLLSYAITGFSSLLTDFIFGLDGPALVGIFAILPWVISGWFSTYTRESQ